MLDKSKLIKSTVALTAVSLIGRIASVPKNIIVGMAMPVAAFGLYNTIFLWFSYLTVLSSFTNGLFATASRESAHHFGIAGEEQKGIDIQNKAVSGGLLISLAILAGYFAVALRKPTALEKEGFVFVGIYFLLGQIGSLYERFNSAKNLFTGVAMANLLNDLAAAVLVMAAVYRFGIHALFIAPIIAMAVKIAYFRTKMPLFFSPTWDPKEIRRLSASAFFFGATALVSNLYAVIDRTFISIYLNDTVMGLYSFGLMSVMMLQTLFATFQGVFYDTINKSAAMDRGVAEKVMHYNYYFLFFAIFLILASQFGYYVMVRYVVRNYFPSVSIFVILSVMMYFYAMFIMPSALLTSKLMRKENLITFIMLAGVASAILLNYVFVRLGWGGEGIALGTTLSQAVISIGTLFSLLRSNAADPLHHMGRIILASSVFLGSSGFFYYLVSHQYPLPAVMAYSFVAIGALLLAAHYFFQPHPFRMVWDLYRHRG